MHYKEKLQVADVSFYNTRMINIFQQSDSQLFYEQHTLLMAVIPQNKPEII